MQRRNFLGFYAGISFVVGVFFIAPLVQVSKSSVQRVAFDIFAWSAIVAIAAWGVLVWLDPSSRPWQKIMGLMATASIVTGGVSSFFLDSETGFGQAVFWILVAPPLYAACGTAFIDFNKVMNRWETGTGKQ